MAVKLEKHHCEQCMGDIILPDKGEALPRTAVGLPAGGNKVTWFCSIMCASTHPLWTEGLKREYAEEFESDGLKKVNGARQVH